MKAKEMRDVARRLRKAITDLGPRRAGVMGEAADMLEEIADTLDLMRALRKK